MSENASDLSKIMSQVIEIQIAEISEKLSTLAPWIDTLSDQAKAKAKETIAVLDSTTASFRQFCIAMAKMQADQRKLTTHVDELVTLVEQELNGRRH